MAKYDANQPQAPFLIGMEPSNMRSGVVESTSTFSEAYDRDTQTMKPIGTRDYVVIGYCPSLSVYFGRGAGSFPETSKLAGLLMLQTDNLS